MPFANCLITIREVYMIEIIINKLFNIQVQNKESLKLKAKSNTFKVLEQIL